MSTLPEFHVEVAQNQFLAPGTADVNAIITVSATQNEPNAQADAAEIVIVDCSASMHRPSKLNAAKQATIAAIDAMRDGVAFAVVAGNDVARLIYPQTPALAIAGEHTKAAARDAVTGLAASGGTAMGQWLWLAQQLFDTHRSEIRHAILLTDGRDTSETSDELDSILDTVEGRFVCDCRGVGTDWEVGELREIATALLGTVDIVAEPADLEADFRAMTEAAMGKTVADVALRLWTPQGALIKFVKQVEPSITDLTDRRYESAAQSGDYPTGSWGAESRAYHACVQVEAAEIGDKMLACRASVIARGGEGDEPVLAKGRVLATWTDDTALTTAIDPTVAHYTGQAELAEAIHEGLAARKAGDVETATTKLGRAVALANESGHDETAKLLAGVVEVEDPERGTVRLKTKVATVDEMTLDTRSTVTKRVGKRGGG